MKTLLSNQVVHTIAPFFAAHDENRSIALKVAMMFVVSSTVSALLATSILLAACISLPTFYLRRQFLRNDNGLYHDIDGGTTFDAEAVFVQSTQRYVMVILVISGAGLIVNITAAVLLKPDMLDKASDGSELGGISLRLFAAVRPAASAPHPSEFFALHPS